MSSPITASIPLALASFIAAAQSASTPALRLRPAELALGLVLDAQVVEQSLLVENEADRPVEIVDVRDSCGSCVAYNLEEPVLAPGQSTLLHLHIDPWGLEGPVRILLVPVTSDTTRPQRGLEIVAEVVPAFRVEGGPVVLEGLVQGHQRAQRVRMAPRVALPSPLVRVSADQPGFAGTVSWDPVQQDYEVVVVAGPDLPLGDQAAVLMVECDDPTAPKCRIPVLARVVPPIQVLPDQLVLDRVDREQLRILFVRQFLDPPVAVTRLELPGDTFQYRFFDDSALSRQRINVYSYGMQSRTGFVGNIVIHTDHEEAGRIEIPVRVENLSGVFVAPSCLDNAQSRTRRSRR